MSSRSKRLVSQFQILLLAVAATIIFCGSKAMAQEPAPAPKWELFGGYSWASPGGKVLGRELRDETSGFGASITYNGGSRWAGLTLDFAHHIAGSEGGPGVNASLTTLQVGPKFTYRGDHFSPFIEALVGWSRLTPDGGFDSNNKIGFTGGGGLDMPINRHFGIRVIQADFLAADHRFVTSSVAPATHLRGVRLQTGLVWMMGGNQAPEAPAAASCSVSPQEVMPGEPVKVTATASNFSPKRPVAYSWSSTGGKVSGTESTVTVDTTGLAAGSYTVTSKLTDNRKANAQCTSTFSVKELPKNAPTMSCSASPATVRSGESATVTCDCKSPDNRPVTVSAWTASSGKISGSGNTGTLDTAGAAPGSININASCSDDRGLTAQSSASVNVEAPPEKPKSSKLDEIEFKKNNARVDNAAKAILDRVADRLLQDPNSRAVVVGETDNTERGRNLAAQRAVNAKAYLTSGENQKAVDPSRIDVRTGGAGGMRDEIFVVPEGATFEEPNTAPVDEARIKPQVKKAVPVRKARRKAGAKPATTP